jgi:hypothetical protein
LRLGFLKPGRAFFVTIGGMLLGATRLTTFSAMTAI